MLIRATEKNSKLNIQATINFININNDLEYRHPKKVQTPTTNATKARWANSTNSPIKLHSPTSPLSY